MVKEDLKPCPRCGSSRLVMSYGSFSLAVECLNCSKYGPSRMTEEHAVSEWNSIRRPLEYTFKRTKQMELGEGLM